MNIEKIKPIEIEKRSFEIIGSELKEMGISLDAENADIIMRVIHTTADFDYAKSLKFSEDSVKIGINALKSGISIVTDTQMTKAGINKSELKKLGGEVYCFMSDDDVAEKAKTSGITRACASMEKAAQMNGRFIFALGNAPTALIKLCELIDEGKVDPALVIGVPVGFVNVVQSKEILAERKIPFIAAMGRKGGSNVAAAICNALIYKASGRK